MNKIMRAASYMAIPAVPSALIGAASDRENRARGAVVGAAIGSGAGFGLGHFAPDIMSRVAAKRIRHLADNAAVHKDTRDTVAIAIKNLKRIDPHTARHSLTSMKNDFLLTGHAASVRSDIANELNQQYKYTTHHNRFPTHGEILHDLRTIKAFDGVSSTIANNRRDYMLNRVVGHIRDSMASLPTKDQNAIYDSVISRVRQKKVI